MYFGENITAIIKVKLQTHTNNTKANKRWIGVPKVMIHLYISTDILI